MRRSGSYLRRFTEARGKDGLRRPSYFRSPQICSPLAPDSVVLTGGGALGRRRRCMSLVASASSSSSSSSLYHTTARCGKSQAPDDDHHHINNDDHDDGDWPGLRLVHPRPPVEPHRRPQEGRRSVPSPPIVPPPYAATGLVPPSPNEIYLHTDAGHLQRMRRAARVARDALDFACAFVSTAVSADDPSAVSLTTNDVDALVHEYLIQRHGAYPSPLNYVGFPKSLCTSVGEIVCHGIPDDRPLMFGDVVSLDVSCFVDGVHGDNCATVIVGDHSTDSAALARSPHEWTATPPALDRDADDVNDAAAAADWRGVPYKTDLHPDDVDYFENARRLVRATREAVYAGIAVCQPGVPLHAIGNAIHDVADKYGYDTVRKYRGHGISHHFHQPPYIEHFRNPFAFPPVQLREGMIFTIEPMFTMGSADCYEWPSDQWTVATVDGSLAAQFEHTILVTETGAEILTLPLDD